MNSSSIVPRFSLTRFPHFHRGHLEEKIDFAKVERSFAGLGRQLRSASWLLF